MKRFPEQVLVYVSDTLQDGTHVYSVACEVDEIPEEMAGEKVAVYILDKECSFAVKRELRRELK